MHKPKRQWYFKVWIDLEKTKVEKYYGHVNAIKWKDTGILINKFQILYYRSVWNFKYTVLG